MSRLRSAILTVGALAIAAYSAVPPWVEVVPLRGSRGIPSAAPVEAPRLMLTHPLGSWPLWAPPTPKPGHGVRIDYASLALYYLGTLALMAPFLLWRGRSRRPGGEATHGAPEDRGVAYVPPTRPATKGALGDPNARLP